MKKKKRNMTLAKAVKSGELVVEITDKRELTTLAELFFQMDVERERKQPVRPFVEAQLARLIQRYKLVEDPTHGPKQQAAEKRGRRGRDRGYKWVNADKVYRGEFKGLPVEVVLFDGPHPWLHVGLGRESAVSSRWDGERSGCAIPRIPYTLRGCMWRDSRNHYVRPTDVMLHLWRLSQETENQMKLHAEWDKTYSEVHGPDYDAPPWNI